MAFQACKEKKDGKAPAPANGLCGAKVQGRPQRSRKRSWASRVNARAQLTAPGKPGGKLGKAWVPPVGAPR